MIEGEVELNDGEEGVVSGFDFLAFATAAKSSLLDFSQS
jgi:hypothetical protein